MKPLLVIDRGVNVHHAVLARLGQGFDVRLLDADGRALDSELLSAAQVLWTGLARFVGKEVFDTAPNLRILATPTTGLTHVDQQEAARRGIEILSFRGRTGALADVRATAEHTIGLLLALLRRIAPAFDSIKHGRWNRAPFQGREIFGKRVGLIGYGRLGRITAGYFEAFGASVQAFDPYVKDQRAPLIAWTELLETSEIISVHASLNEESHGLLDQRAFRAMAQCPVLVNTARGELVDEPALLRALEQRQIAGAALDVIALEHEPRPAGDPLFSYACEHDNLLLTPHIGGLTVESREKTDSLLANLLLKHVHERQRA
ncbi:MAG: hypothetical protein KJZ84_03340 [Bryobacteraceae bacterium]|nr:hypothetical protein [Bryobacteraceae bacterium]